jgi:hypothetical protein
LFIKNLAATLRFRKPFCAFSTENLTGVVMSDTTDTVLAVAFLALILIAAVVGHAWASGTF